MITKEQAIKIWKDSNLDEVIWKFDCGGDQMNDTEFYTEGLDESLKQYLEEEIFNNVTFYEASDGYYQGESGEVVISLYDDEEDFCFSKSATSEYEDDFNDTVEVKLSDEAMEHLKSHVSNVQGADWEGYTFTYKDDFIVTPEIEALEESIKKAIKDVIDSFQPDKSKYEGELIEDRYSLDSEIEFCEGSIKLTVSFGYRYYRESEED